MKVHLSPATLPEWTGECLLALCCAPTTAEAPLILPSALVELDQSVWGGILAELITEHEFKGKVLATASTRVAGVIRKVILVGLGIAEKVTPETLRSAVAVGLRQAHQLKSKQVSIMIPAPFGDPIGIRAIAEASLLVAHQDSRFKNLNPEAEKPSGFQVNEVVILGTEDTAPNQLAVHQAQEIAAGTILARELVNAPANIVTPLTLADTARELATSYGLNVEILGQAECEALGMGAFLGVAKASDLPPQFIHLTYKPTGTPLAKLALIGKGLTFDSGGLNIKTDGRSIAMMKTDMGGSAAVLGTARAMAALQPSLELHFIVAATENMISGHAMHPGDILTASNHKTIEINNTDAEGRLTLADALVFAEKLEVDAIVDLATLTGACVVALGTQIGGLFSPNDALAAELLAAATVSGEKLWRMPLEESYGEGLNSVVADMKNTGPREGGAITASLFLKHFVQSTPWAHLDIAGTVWADRDNGYWNKGATGYGVRLLSDWLLSKTDAL